MDMIKAVLFDLDGVLVDACEWHRQALNKSLKYLHNYEISIADHNSIYNGWPTKTKLLHLQSLGLIPTDADLELINDLKQFFTIRLITKHCKPIVDIQNLLLYLSKCHIKMACVTNSIKYTAELMLVHANIIGFMDLIVSNEDVKNPKPSPEGYQLAMTKLYVQPEQCIIVEDSPKGLEAAKLTQAHVWQVSGPHDLTIERYKSLCC